MILEVNKTTDLGNWRKIDNIMIFPSWKGQMTRPSIDYRFPKDYLAKCFSHTSFTREVRNVENRDMWLLIYSKFEDKIFFLRF